jgi:ribosomal protein S18 acetylase RimI-like enzyme
MIIKLDPDPEELSVIARMHALSLPKSVITRLGPSYVEQFYRFVSNSKNESVFVAHLHGKVVGSALLSTARATLSWRALIGTSLAWRLLFAPRLAFDSAWEMLSGFYYGDSTRFSANVELLAIFVDELFRSQGIGQELLGGVESELQNRGFHDYFVRTVEDEHNRAISFYLREGFEELGSVRTHGNTFRLLKKHLELR